MRQARAAVTLSLLLVAPSLWAQTSAEATGQGQAAAAATAAATTASGLVLAEDVTTYAADFELDADETLTAAVGVVMADNTIWSIEVWVQLETEGINQGVLGHKGAVNDYSSLFFATTDRLRLYNETNLWVELADIDLTGIGGSWHHIVVAVDGSDGNNVFPYLDGTAMTVRTLADTSFVLRTLGGNGHATNYTLDGMIAHCGVWPGRQLDQAAVTALYDAGPDLLYADLTAAQKTNLASWWDVEEESGQRADSHGAIHLTDNNTVGRAEVIYP